MRRVSARRMSRRRTHGCRDREDSLRRFNMRFILTLLMISGIASGQAAEQVKPQPASPGQEQSAAAAQAAPAVDPHSVVIPAGTKVPLTLKQAISTKNAREGDPVYAETAFPFVAN